MKSFCIFLLAFFVLGVFSVSAQDLIVLKDGNIIEAKVMEISPSEIRYKRIDHLEGPTIVIMATNVLSIRYENGRTEIINAFPVTGQQITQARSSENTAIDPNKFIFGINANAGGTIASLYASGGPSISIELGKGNFNSEINLIFPIFGGFEGLVSFNYFWHNRIGGAYLGGGIGFGYYDFGRNSFLSLPIGLNVGHKFVTKSGVFFRTGAFLGYNILFELFYLKPDLAIGWTMR